MKIGKLRWPAEVISMSNSTCEVNVCGKGTRKVKVMKLEDCMPFQPSPGLIVGKPKLWRTAYEEALKLVNG